MFLSPGELYKGLIIDSEGLEYGFVCDVDLSDEPVIRACIEFSGEGEYPDVESLKQMISDLGYEVSDDTGLEELVLIARREGLKIPYTRASTRIRLVKGIIKPEEILVVDTIYKYRVMDDMKTTVIVLNNPREARYRGLKTPYGEVKPVKPSRVIGKLVVDLGEGILGWIETIVFGCGGIGLRINTRFSRGGRINYDEFLNKLDNLNPEIGEKIRKKIQYSGFIDVSYYGEIWRILEEINAPDNAFKLLNESVELEPYYIEYRDIPWNTITRINDIVLTKMKTEVSEK